MGIDRDSKITRSPFPVSECFYPWYLWTGEKTKMKKLVFYLSGSYISSHRPVKQPWWSVGENWPDAGGRQAGAASPRCWSASLAGSFHGNPATLRCRFQRQAVQPCGLPICPRGCGWSHTASLHGADVPHPAEAGRVSGWIVQQPVTEAAGAHPLRSRDPFCYTNFHRLQKTVYF